MGAPEKAKPEDDKKPKKIGKVRTSLGVVTIGAGLGLTVLLPALYYFDILEVPEVVAATEPPPPEPPTLPTSDVVVEKPTIPRVVEVPQVPKLHFAGADDYQQALLNYGGYDQDGDGVNDWNSSNEINFNATPDEVADFQNSLESADVALSDEQAAEALSEGGFTKDGKTYEIWVNDADPSRYTITEVPEGHPLVGNVPSYDNEIEMPVTDLSVDQDADATFGEIDPETGEVVPCSGRQGLADRLDFLEMYSIEDYEGRNPWRYNTWEYTEWQKIHDFLTRHSN